MAVYFSSILDSIRSPMYHRPDSSLRSLVFASKSAGIPWRSPNENSAAQPSSVAVCFPSVPDSIWSPKYKIAEPQAGHCLAETLFRDSATYRSGPVYTAVKTGLCLVVSSFQNSGISRRPCLYAIILCMLCQPAAGGPLLQEDFETLLGLSRPSELRASPTDY